MIFDGKLYTAEEMYEIGVVDLVVDTGAGEQELRNYIGDQRKHKARCGVYRARQRINPLTLEELRDVADLWVETVINLSPADLRRMNHLKRAQARRLQRNSLLR
jgi:DSF synthase